VTTRAGATAIGRPKGEYLSYDAGDTPTLPPATRAALVAKLAGGLKHLLRGATDVLVAGLGNRHMTADAFGCRVVDLLPANRHICAKHGQKYALSAFAPGVLGQTGMETHDVLLGVVTAARPQAVVCVDSLAARNYERVGRVFQATDTGIIPGGGIGNRRVGLSRDTLGVPVVSLGVPFVVYAAQLARDALARATAAYPSLSETHATLQAALLSDPLDGLVVTPKDIDLLVEECAKIAADALFSMQNS
jgi:spore protease